MTNMFLLNPAFNQPIGARDTSSVTDMVLSLACRTWSLPASSGNAPGLES